MATASTPSSCSARITRTAISPRFATKTLVNISGPLNRVERPAVDPFELEEKLAVLDGLGVPDVDRAHDPLDFGLHFVHQLHRLENAERLTRADRVAYLDEGGCARCGRAVEGADHRAFDPDQRVVAGRDRRGLSVGARRGWRNRA